MRVEHRWALAGITTGDSGGNNPHGDVSRADVTQDVSEIQCGDDDDDDDIQDWDFEVLNHVLVEILDKERVVFKFILFWRHRECVK